MPNAGIITAETMERCSSGEFDLSGFSLVFAKDLNQIPVENRIWWGEPPFQKELTQSLVFLVLF